MKFAQLENLPWRKIDGRAVIIQPKNGQVHELDEVGTFLWVAADGKKTIAETVELLAEEFELDAETATNDAEEFYRSLLDLGLLTTL